jgi:molybdopterin-guanine dinucleotide biosynthesis protein A
VHPVIGLWPVEMAPDLRKALDEGVRKVGAWTERQGAIEVTFPLEEVGGKPIDPFFNINRSEMSPRWRRC